MAAVVHDQISVMEEAEIKSILPHREPMLFVHKVTSLWFSENRGQGAIICEFVVAEKHCAGHYPGNPIFPGNHTIEALEQAGGILLFAMFGGKKSDGFVPFLRSSSGAKLTRPVKPGNCLRLEVFFVNHRAMLFKLMGKASVGGREVARLKEFTIALAEV